jgi:aspartate racemase
MSSLSSTPASYPAIKPALDPSRLVLGVLGGMGPLAGAAFAMRLVQLTSAANDQQHIPVLLCNDPRIPDRSSAYMAGTESPLPAMVRGIRVLEQGGAGLIAIPCNTAHLWFDSLAQATSLPVLHIVQSVIDDLRRQGVAGGPVGVMGTEATLKLGLYQTALQQAGYEPLLLDPHETQAYCLEPIRLVKEGQTQQAFAPAAQGVRLLAQRGARAVVLGCTELPLAVPHAQRAGLGVVVTDSIDALALAAIDAIQARERVDGAV